MLQKLNERIQGIFAWIVIVLVALTFTMFGVDYYMQSRHNTHIEVEVNDQAISKQAVEASYRRHRQQHDSNQLTAAVEAKIKKQVLDDLVVNAVMVQSAKSNGFDVSASQALASIESIAQFQEDGQFSAERYQQALSGAYFTPETFQYEVKQGMLLNQQRFAFMGTAFVLPNEVKQFVKLYMQTRDFDELVIPVKRFMDKVQVSPKDIEAYYQSHHDKFMTDETVKTDYVALSLADVKKDIQISDDEAKQYYEDNESNYTTPTQWQVAHILFALTPDSSDADIGDVEARAQKTYELLKADPQQFSSLAKKISDDKISAINEGKLPWLVAGQTEFDDALSQLKEVGQISAPVKTRHGYEIFKLLAYKPSEVKPYDSVQNEIKDQLLVELAQAKFAESLEELSDVSYQSPDSLVPVAQALKLPIRHSDMFSREGSDEGMSANKQVVKAAFSRDVLELGNNSDPIQIDNDTVIVLRVSKHEASKSMPLEEVKVSIEKRLKLDKARLLAKQEGEKIIAMAKNKVKLSEALSQQGLVWKSHTRLTRDSDEVTVEINEFAFSLPGVHDIKGLSLSNGNYVLVSLKKINNGQLVDLDKEQQASLSQQIESNYGLMDYDLYVNALMKKAKIVRHENA